MTDDTGRSVQLSGTVSRIVSLAPNLTELLFEIGAGEMIVGTVDFSDYPAAALTLPRIGSHDRLDLESIVALKPDLVLAWESGNPRSDVETLEKAGFPIYRSEPKKIADIAQTLHRLGQLTGRAGIAAMRAQALVAAHDQLARQYEPRATINVFYQVWHSPVITLNEDHIVNEVIEKCGGRNVFASLPTIAPVVTPESVIRADPDVIIASSENDETPKWLLSWHRWSSLSAVKNNHLYAVPADHLSRHTSRIIDGMQRICEILETVRISPAGPAS